jgi:hypothetical protein
MRATSTQLTLFLTLLVALMLVGTFVVKSAVHSQHNYTITIGHQRFGFADFYSEMAERHKSNIYLGSLGTHEVSFPATVNLVCFVVLLTLVTVLAVFITALALRSRRSK